MLGFGFLLLWVLYGFCGLFFCFVLFVVSFGRLFVLLVVCLWAFLWKKYYIHMFSDNLQNLAVFFLW